MMVRLIDSSAINRARDGGDRPADAKTINSTMNIAAAVANFILFVPIMRGSRASFVFHAEQKLLRGRTLVFLARNKDTSRLSARQHSDVYLRLIRPIPSCDPRRLDI